MSATQLMQSTSTTAIVIETLIAYKGLKTVKVEYIDGMARPDLVGKKSTFFELIDQNADLPKPGQIVHVSFLPKKGRLGETYYAGRVSL